jgi:hypothetical protein
MNSGPLVHTSDESSISILHLNIRSIRNKLDFIKENLLDYDILCFTETHLTYSIGTPNDLLLESSHTCVYRRDVTARSS